MKVLAIVNQKGGVGKTTTAVTLAHALARAGRQVLLVDLDAQGNVADALGMEKQPGLYDLLVRERGREAVTDSYRPGLDVVLSNVRTVEVKQILAGSAFREYRLAEVLGTLAGYDIAILDAAPGVDVLQIGALLACTDFLVPVALDHLAVVGAGDALASVASLDRVGVRRGRFLGVLPTMWERVSRESHEQLEVLARQFGKMVWPPIPMDVRAREAPAYGKTLYEYAPRTRAVIGVRIGAMMVGGYERVVGRMAEELGVGEGKNGK